MSAKGYIITLSLAGTVAALSCWLLPGKEAPAPQSAAQTGKTAPGKRAVRNAPQSTARADTGARRNPSTPAAAPRSATASRPISSEELNARAARVEQEANHELRRLVTLLNLDEAQQERVFQTLAEHSPSWTPGMTFAPADSSTATPAGKRSEIAAALPLPVKDTTAVETPAATVTPGSDPTDEIMALLDPDQQNTLIEAELDRAAWWAEVLEQITPPDEVPSLVPATPSTGAGDTQIYEGSDVLE